MSEGGEEKRKNSGEIALIRRADRDILEESIRCHGRHGPMNTLLNHAALLILYSKERGAGCIKGKPHGREWAKFAGRVTPPRDRARQIRTDQEGAFASNSLIGQWRFRSKIRSRLVYSAFPEAFLFRYDLSETSVVCLAIYPAYTMNS